MIILPKSERRRMGRLIEKKVKMKDLKVRQEGGKIGTRNSTMLHFGNDGSRRSRESSVQLAPNCKAPTECLGADTARC